MTKSVPDLLYLYQYKGTYLIYYICNICNVEDSLTCTSTVALSLDTESAIVAATRVLWS